jgi:Fe-S cluster assembly protein SufD
MAFEEKIDVNSDLHDIRTSAIKKLWKQRFSNQEAWKYTHSMLFKNDFSVFPKHENSLNSRK